MDKAMHDAMTNLQAAIARLPDQLVNVSIAQIAAHSAASAANVADIKHVIGTDTIQKPGQLPDWVLGTAGYDRSKRIEQPEPALSAARHANAVISPASGQLVANKDQPKETATTASRHADKAFRAVKGSGRVSGGPTGLAVGSLSQFASVAIGATVALKKFADGAIQANKEFAVAPAMAMVFAVRDMQETFRNMRKGAALAPGAREAVQAEQHFKDKIEPWEIKFGAFKNEIAKNTFSMFSDVIEQAEDMTTGEWWGNLFRAKKNRKAIPGSASDRPSPLGGLAGRKLFESAAEAGQSAWKEVTEEPGQDMGNLFAKLFDKWGPLLTKAIADGSEEAWKRHLDIMDRSAARDAVTFSDIGESMSRAADQRREEARERVRGMELDKQLDEARKRAGIT